MDFKSEQERYTYKTILGILANQRAGPNKIISKLKAHKEKNENVKIYSTESKWNEVIHNLVSSDIFPVRKETDGSLLEREDVNYRKEVVF